MKRTTIKSLTLQAKDYMDILFNDVICGNYSQLHKRLGTMSKKDLLKVIDDVSWRLYDSECCDSEKLIVIHKYAVKAMEDKL